MSDSGWHGTIPDQAEIILGALILPHQADTDGWTRGVQREVEDYLRRWCDTDSWLAEHPPTFRWHTEVNPSETPTDAPSVQALLGANAALGLPPTLGGLGSWYDGATFALEAGTPRSCTGPATSTGRTPSASTCRSTISCTAHRDWRSPRYAFAGELTTDPGD